MELGSFIFVIPPRMWKSMNRARNEAAVIAHARPDPLFIVHLTDKQWIEANVCVRDRSARVTTRYFAQRIAK